VAVLFFVHRILERKQLLKENIFIWKKYIEVDTMKKTIVFISVIIFILAFPFIIDKLTEYYYLDFLMLTPVDLEVLESSVNKDFYINGILVAPEIRTNDGEEGEYSIYAGLRSYSNNSIVNINNVSVKTVSNNIYKSLVFQEQNTEKLCLNTEEYSDNYYMGYNDFIGTFIVDFDDINIDDIEFLELTVNLTVENRDKSETKEIKYIYYPKNIGHPW
jgi:hypothetical protein